jgi:hypothetical protein
VLPLLLRIREIPRSNLVPETGILSNVFRGFTQSLEANTVIVPEVRAWPLLSISF